MASAGSFVSLRSFARRSGPLLAMLAVGLFLRFVRISALYRALDAGRDTRQLLPCGMLTVLGSKPQTEAVALEAGYDVQMDVEDFLAGNLAVGEEKIHPVAS